ncbi:MAG TPA: type II toxin-antitoxin system HicB family antitoxin [Dehalococcoidia bacterium]|nr:type II toxin-antitoxin system HicB family antitoxin [Dehalococcoidia bacterium]
MKEVLVSVHLEELPEGGFLATSEELPGLIARGRTVAETLEIAQDVARKLLESYREHGDELPPALKTVPGTTVDLRIPVSIA